MKYHGKSEHRVSNHRWILDRGNGGEMIGNKRDAHHIILLGTAKSCGFVYSDIKLSCTIVFEGVGVINVLNVQSASHNFDHTMRYSPYDCAIKKGSLSIRPSICPFIAYADIN